MYFRSAQWADAAHYFEVFVQIDNGRAPNHVLINALYDLGKTYELMGNLDVAVEMYHVFIEIADPNDTRIRTVQAELEKFEGAKK
jgi:tetratricopeptide (TPR) repeat protein